MHVESHLDFPELRTRIERWKKAFPMFLHDVKRIQDTVEEHIKEYSNHLIRYRQSKSKRHLEKAQEEIDKINEFISTIEKTELMALLSKR